jgi:glycosyltransferase involved in cell wall biosynthesis
MAKSLVSVIIPTYNRAAIVAQAIDSALAQTHQALQVIVVDDGSSDNTAEMLRTKYGSSISLISKPNGGVSTARNTGIDAAAGDYIAYLDSDDLWDKERVERMLDALPRAEGAPVFAFCDFRRSTLDNRTDAYGKTNTQIFPLIFDYFSSLGGALYTTDPEGAFMNAVNGYPFFPSTFLLGRDLHTHYRWDPAVKYGEDFNFVTKISRFAKFYYVDEVLVTVRMHDGNKSMNHGVKIPSYIKTLNMIAASHSDDRRKLSACQRAMNRAYEDLALHYFRTGAAARGLAYFVRAKFLDGATTRRIRRLFGSA